MNKRFGFTIVELLVVIVIIGILAAITVVSYTGISNKAIISSLQSDLAGASVQLKMYQVEYGVYPTMNASNCPTTPADSKYCLKSTPGNTLAYSSSSPFTTFTLDATKGDIKYRITNNTPPSLVPALVLPPNTTDNGDGTYTTTIYADSSDGSIGINIDGSSSYCPTYKVLANQALIDRDSSSDCYDLDLDQYFGMRYNYFVKFRIDFIPGSISSASLYVYKTIYWVASGSDPRKAASIPDYGTLDSSDFNSTPYNSNLGTIFNFSDTVGYHSLSVSSAVNLDKINGRNYSSFKIYPNSSWAQNILNSSTAANNKPYLLVTWTL